MQTTTSVASHSRTGEAKPMMGGILIKPMQFSRTSPMFVRNGSVMSHTFAKFKRFIGNYRYYRGKGFNSKASWYLAGMTLP